MHLAVSSHNDRIMITNTQHRICSLALGFLTAGALSLRAEVTIPEQNKTGGFAIGCYP